MSEKREVQLDPVLQARLLAQMQQEQEAAVRARSIRNWILVPIALVALVAGTVLMFSDNLGVAFGANTIATGIAWVLWRTNRERIRDWIGV